MAEVPIDRGWAWWTVVGASINILLVVGGFKSMGILFVHMLEKFDASPTLAGIMLGLMSFGLSLFSPFVTALGLRFSYRLVVMLGGVIAATAFFVAAFADNVYTVVCVLGVLVGVANGCLFTPSMVIVGQYFDRYRSLAMGIVMAFGSVGQLVLPFLFQYMLDEYGFSGCMLIYSGIAAHSVVAGCLMRPLSFYKRRIRRKQTQATPKVIQELKNEPVPSPKVILKNEALLQPSPKPVRNMKHEMNSHPSPKAVRNLKNDLLAPPSPKALHCLRQEEKFLSALSLTVTPAPSLTSLHLLHHGNRSQTGTPRQFHDSCVRLDDAESHLRGVNALLLDNFDDDDSDTSSIGICASVMVIFDRAVLTSAFFWLYLFGVAFALSGYLMQFAFLPPYGRELGLSKDEVVIVLAVAGAADAAGRLLGGAANTLRVVRTGHLVGGSLLLTAVTIGGCLLAPGLAGMVGHGACLGLLGGTFIALYPVSLVDNLGLELYPKALSLIVMGVGVFTVGLPPLFGLIQRVLGSFVPVFWICVVLMAVGALFFIMEPVGLRVDQQRLQNSKCGQEDATCVTANQNTAQETTANHKSTPADPKPNHNSSANHNVLLVTCDSSSANGCPPLAECKTEISSESVNVRT